MSDVLAVACIVGAAVMWLLINELNFRRSRYLRPQLPPLPLPPNDWTDPVGLAARRRSTFRPGSGYNARGSQIASTSAADSSAADNENEEDYEGDYEEPSPPYGPVPVPTTVQPQPHQPQAQALALPPQSQQRNHQYIEGIGTLVDVFPWLADLDGNDQRKGNHHTLIAGESDAGKSTLARAMLTCRSYSGWVLVLNPHAKRDNWGVPVIGGGRDYLTLNRAMELLLAEMDRRYDEPEGVEFESLSIFIDEWPSIQDECPLASRFMKKLAMEGRKVRMRLVVLSQSRLVEDLGLKGSSDIKKSFATVLLGSFAHTQMAALRPLSHAGLLLARGQQLPMVTSEYPQIVGHYKARLDRFYKLPGIVARSTWPARTTSTTTTPDPTAERMDMDRAAASRARPEIDRAAPVKTFSSPFSVSQNGPKERGKFPGLETPFSASQKDFSAFSVSELPFSLEEIAQITAQITRREKGKTEIVKNMPGYAARKHALYATYYDRLAGAINININTNTNTSDAPERGYHYHPNEGDSQERVNLAPGQAPGRPPAADYYDEDYGIQEQKQEQEQEAYSSDEEEEEE